jgi:hypothetical protein
MKLIGSFILNESYGGRFSTEESFGFYIYDYYFAADDML